MDDAMAITGHQRGVAAGFREVAPKMDTPRYPSQGPGDEEDAKKLKPVLDWSSLRPDWCILICLPKDFTVGEQESLVELSWDETLKSAFRRQLLLDWKQQHREYPALKDKPVHFFLPFATIYLCDKGFSAEPD